MQCFRQFLNRYCISRHQMLHALRVSAHNAVRAVKQTLVGLQGVSSRIWTSARLGEDLRKLMFFNVQDFSKHVLRLVGCSNLHNILPQAHWAKKSTWFRTKSLQSPTGRFSKNFWIYQKLHNTQEARVCTGSAVSSPKLSSRS